MSKSSMSFSWNSIDRFLKFCSQKQEAESFTPLLYAMNEIDKINTFLAFKLSNDVFIMLINVKIPTIVGILTFISMTHFMLSRAEHENSFIISGTGSLIRVCN